MTLNHLSSICQHDNIKIIYVNIMTAQTRTVYKVYSKLLIARSFMPSFLCCRFTHFRVHFIDILDYGSFFVVFMVIDAVI